MGKGETSDYTREGGVPDGPAASYSRDPKPQEKLSANVRDIEKMFQLNGKENSIMKAQILKNVDEDDWNELSRSDFGKFQFVDYGESTDKLSRGLETLLKQFTVSKFDQCNGERAAIILYGGSGAGKTKNTEAIMGKMDDLFQSSLYK